MKELVSWKRRSDRKPLIIRGARQVGKTWLMKAFAAQEYEDSVYITFDDNRPIRRIFEPDLDPKRIVSELELAYQKKIDPASTLLIFDEIQETPEALKALKYFREQAPEYQIVCAGSLLGVALHPGTSFPVGKVEFMDLYPLSFTEFLRATGDDGLADLIENGDSKSLRLFREALIKLLAQYFYIGGMPEVVALFSESREFEKCRAIQRQIIDLYELDFSKHAPAVHIPKIRALWNSVPAQLGKERKKFVYGEIGAGARAREYETAMLWILDTGIAYRANAVTDVKHPLKAYENLKAFKLYLVDIGLLSCMSGLDRKILMDGDSVFVEFKGAMTEQFVLQELVARCGYAPYYWSNADGRAEVDFVIEQDGKAVPIEAKSGVNLRAKSLMTYIEKFSPELAVRTSLADYKTSDHKGTTVLDVPLFAVSSLPRLLAESRGGAA